MRGLRAIAVPWCAAVFACLLSIQRRGQTATSLSIQQNGWTIAYSPTSASLTISVRDLGIVARDLQFNEQTPSGLQRITRFSPRIDNNHRLVLKSTAPTTIWLIDALPDKVTISTAGFQGVVRGWAPSSANRTIAILLDPKGEPVKWEGTYEALTTYGGSLTSNVSYLPQLHPEVMHMALGQISGAGMHSLFDVATDTAIDFGPGAVLQVPSDAKDVYALTIPVQDYATIQLTPDYFTKVLHVPFYVPYRDTHFPTAPAVWSSWPIYYEHATEQDIIRNTDWLADNLKPYGFDYVVLDDGYDRTPYFSHPEWLDHTDPGETSGHDWIENWSTARFPHGPKWLTSYIHAKGLKAGVWLVPNAYARALENHPDWYLYDKQGHVVTDYDTPALDSTSPQVLDFLHHLFSTLDNFGFDYYKFDGDSALPAYVPSIDRSRLYSPSADFIQAFRKRFAVIRQTLGPERFIEECPAGTPLNALGFVNAYFNGQDVFENWDGMYPYFSSITGNLFLNHMVTYVMPGEGMALTPHMTMAQAAVTQSPSAVDALRARDELPSGFGTTLAEARTLVTYTSLTGVVYPIANVMPDLPPERVQLLKETLPTLPILPIDLFSRGAEGNVFKPVRDMIRMPHFPEVLDLKINASAGIYDVVAETNWGSETIDRTLFFNQLGLPPDLKYVVFDFWKQQPLGVFNHQLDLSIEPHDTRVLALHPLANHPQLIGLSRHISGTYSILSQSWDTGASELHGESKTMLGVPYTLWFYFPDGYKKSLVQVISETGQTIDATWQEQGTFASLHFTGVDERVAWRIHF